MIREESLIRNGVLRVAELMAIAAKTAPKARGIDNITTMVIHSREELKKLADKMRELSKDYGDYLARDANNVENSDAVFLIGARKLKLDLKPIPGFDMDTFMSIINLGIAVSSAVKIASVLNVDNRIMFSIGVAAKELNLMNAEYILGVPLSVKGKNIYFDRERR